MSEETHPLVEMTDLDLERLLKRAVRDTLLLGLLIAIVLLLASGWRNAGMMVVGTLICMGIEPEPPGGIRGSRSGITVCPLICEATGNCE